MTITKAIAQRDVTADFNSMVPISGAQPVGNDIVDIYNKLKNYFDSLNLSDYADDAVHWLLHFLLDNVIPMLKGWGVSTDMILALTESILKKIDEHWHPNP